MTPRSRTGPAGNLRRVLDALLDGVVVVDEDGALRHLNAEACRILGTSSEAVAGRPVERVAGGEAFAKSVRAVLAGGASVVTNEVPLPRRFEAALVVDVAVSPIPDEAGCPRGAVVLLHDRTIGTALRAVESERAQSAALGRMAAGIAHEVRNPLAGIRGAAELLGRRAGSPRDRAAAELIVREVDRIAALLDDFMVLGRGDVLRLAPVNLHRVLDDVLEVLAADPLGARAQLVRAFDPSLPELLADGDRLVQVFLNLARNALEAMEGRPGKLTIATRLRVDHRLELAGERLPSVAVEVSDTGPGIPEAVRAQVMTPFFTTRSAGTGLGLPLARHFVALHGGSLQLESREGRGTTVHVSLPLRRAGAEVGQ
ncbi:MAG: ATP-binding protein [Deltaproteobacteria bacterium]|nr:ATP-binding protein [Deltaproteobacteria bacterium]